MYGKPSRLRRGGGGRGTPQPGAAQAPPQLMNLNYFQNPTPLPSNGGGGRGAPPQLINPNQLPSFPRPPGQFPHEGFRPQPPPRPKASLERIDLAVVKVRRDLLAAGESVSVWKVSQLALLTLQAESWESLGVRMQLVPSLRNLIMIEGKINAFIHCFVAVRRITSLYDLEVAICNNEGVEQFESLELGPLVRYPLVVHYFSVSSDVTEIFKITSEEIISSLCEFMYTLRGKEIKVEEFLDFIAKKRSVTSREKLSVRIQSIGMHITHIRQARIFENDILKKTLKDLKQKTEIKSPKHPLLSSQKKQLDDYFSSNSQHIKSFYIGDFDGKHIRFASSISEDDDSGNDYEHEVNNKDAQSHCNFLSQATNSSGQVASIKFGMWESINVTFPAPRKKSTEYESIEVGSDFVIDDEMKEFIHQNEADLSLAEDAMRLFIIKWKEACRENNVAEVFGRMLYFYEKPTTRPKKLARDRRKMKSIFSTYPGIGLLNVAVTSIKCGLWESMHDTFPAFTDHGITKTPRKKRTEYESIKVGSHLLIDDEMREFIHQSEADLSLAEDATRMFITSWKEACNENNVAKVFGWMLYFYEKPTTRPKKLARDRRKMKSIFSTYPGIGLLNVAVASIKCGMWESMHGTHRKNYTEYESIKYGSHFVIDDEMREFIHQNEAELSLAEDAIRIFITTWKKACHENNVAEVFGCMLYFYENPTTRPRILARDRRKMKSIFSTYPGIGLLNVAVASIKCGMWESIYDTSQALIDHGITNAPNEKCTESESIEAEPAEKNEYASKCEHIVTVDDIVKKVSAYFELDHNMFSNVKSSFEKIFTFLRKLQKCEFWLIEEFSVKGFESLGYGEFFMFLDKHVSLLPSALQNCLADDACEKSPLEVCLLYRQLAVLLSQASNNLWENENITKETISLLLMRQFPSLSFKLVENGLVKDFIDVVRENKSISTCVLFSATLFGSRLGDPINQNLFSKTAEMGIDMGHKAGTLGSFTTKDAIEVLLRAPLLSDLDSWMHWDLVFAPSLGPLVGWLLNEVNAKELMCLVTKDGKVIRIDHTATMDSFLEASLQGSSFQTAVELLSLFSLYGGERHVPLSLLKCHARQAFEIFMKNSMEMGVNENRTFLVQGNLQCQQQMPGDDASAFSSELYKSKGTVHKAVTVASSFFIDCLGHLPTEFRTFAADVLLSGLRFVIKDAASALLGECKQIKQRLMLHDVGLSLGIVEWIDDYHMFCSSVTTFDSLMSSGASCIQSVSSEFSEGSTYMKHVVNKFPSSKGEMLVSVEVDRHNKESDGVCYALNNAEVSGDCSGDDCKRHLSEIDKEHEAALVIESIRCEEFGLDPCLSDMESSMLKKQHARLGRALHCLSQDLYSQDSHFLLELVQNADDNVYPENAEPTLIFILQKSGIIVLNNENGFSAQNIRALCDVGNSTKKGSGGYIGKKGIGFKSVFRVTDAPEIHSNGFHVKFDISEGQIGFVLPTIVPPPDVDMFRRLVSCDTEKMDTNCGWNTCIVLPFRSKLSEDSAMNSIKSMFSDLHPSLLLFLHRLQCIQFRNMLDDSLIVMRKEIVGNGIVKVSVGQEKMTWFVASQKLQADTIRPDVQTTKISIAFTLQESDNGDYSPRLDQQPVFAFLPLRRYGLKFIIQGDFVLPSSREEVDGDSPWNQWLLSKFPDLFVGAERSFCTLPCFRENPGKAVTAFMSFVPLAGEVHGFFSCLCRLILSKLRMSNCLLVEGDNKKWVLPCKVIRSWNDQARSLLPDSFLHEHLGLGFLDKDIVLSDSLARDLGIEDYGPKILLQIISSLCHSENGLQSMDLVWLSSWLNALYTMVFHSPWQISLNSGTAPDVITDLKKIPFIPLSDGTYGSVDEGTIWLHFDAFSPGFGNDYSPKDFPILYGKLRIVNPAFFSAGIAVDISCLDMSIVDNVIRMLQSVGVQRLSAHEIVKVHILPALSDDRVTIDDKNLMIEYLSFVMSHLQSSCPSCHVEKGDIISDLYNKAFILTNYGYKRPTEVSIHFSKEFGNHIDVNKLINGSDLKWHEVDVAYLNHPITASLPGGMMKWREFFQELGITDFVHIVSVEKSITDIFPGVFNDVLGDKDLISYGAVARDCESPELVLLLSCLSLSGDRIRCKYLLEVLDTLWDDFFSDKATGHCIFDSPGDSRPFKSSFISSLCGVRWMVSSMDDKLHYAKDLFYDCDAVRLILGATAPYAVPKVIQLMEILFIIKRAMFFLSKQVKSEKLLCDIGFKTQVSLDDILSVLQVWRRSETPFTASIAQMSNFYTFIWNEMASSKKKIVEELYLEPFIFIPYSCGATPEDVLPGIFMSPPEVYWHDATGSINQIKEIRPHDGSGEIDRPLCKALCNIYPGLHVFFVHEFGVNEIPHFRCYLEILLQLSTVALPSHVANMVFQVFLQWSDGLKSGLLSSEDVVHLKACLLKLKFTVLPTVLDKWVSLHPSFGLVCWCDDEKLMEEFKHFDNIYFLYFGELTEDEQEMLLVKVSVLMQNLGIPALSKIITREAIYYGLADYSFKASLLNWALSYAQRYMYHVHHDRYFQLKQSGFENLSHLQIVVVEKLFYRNIIIRSGIASKKRVECSCLVQGNVLYATQESDAHSLFTELSRLLFHGTPDLHLANFLHMITIMAESGSSVEQTEFFILNSQKVPKLPDEESIWSLPSMPSTVASPTVINEQNTYKSKRKHGINSNWPPADWKTAPNFSFASGSRLKAQAAVQPQRSSHLQARMQDNSKDQIAHTDHVAPIKIDADWTIEVDPAATTTTLVLPDSVSSEDRCNLITSSVDVAYDSIDLVTPSDEPNLGSSSKSRERDQLSFGTPDAQEALLTGRLGEREAFNYFSTNVGKMIVTWVNEDNETGLPYDIVMGDKETSREYIEVKSTKSARKDWFTISMREWQFAVEKGESFSIAHVILSGNKMARIRVFKNPAKLCLLGNLQLAVVMPKQEQESSIAS